MLPRCRPRPAKLVRFIEVRCIGSVDIERELHARSTVLAFGQGSRRPAAIAKVARELAKQGRRVLLVDADAPAHGMVDILPASASGTDMLQGVQVEHVDVDAATLRLEKIIAAAHWQRLIEEAGGARWAAMAGVPLQEAVDLVGVLAQPPPGIETITSLAMLFEAHDDLFDHIVVDVGSTAQMDILQRVPGAVAEMLAAILQLDALFTESSLPLAVRAGFRFLAGGGSGINQWKQQIAETTQHVADLQSLMLRLTGHVDAATRLLCVDSRSELATAEKLARCFTPHATIFDGAVPRWPHGPAGSLSSLKLHDTGRIDNSCDGVVSESLGPQNGNQVAVEKMMEPGR